MVRIEDKLFDPMEEFGTIGIIVTIVFMIVVAWILIVLMYLLIVSIGAACLPLVPYVYIIFQAVATLTAKHIIVGGFIVLSIPVIRWLVRMRQLFIEHTSVWKLLTVMIGGIIAGDIIAIVNVFATI